MIAKKGFPTPKGEEFKRKKASDEKAVRGIRRKTRSRLSAEGKIPSES